MHAAQCSLARIERNAALHQLGVQSVRLKFSHAKSASEKSARIGVPFRFDDKSILDPGLSENDGSNLLLFFRSTANSEKVYVARQFVPQ